MDTGNISQNIV